VAFLNQTRDAVWLVSRDALTELLARFPEARRARTLIVCDEVHGFGAPSLVSALSGVVQTFGYRLGLRATPEREYDADGNRFLETEIGPVLFRFGLEKAIRRGILCEFDYVALPYIFMDEDRRKVQGAVAAYHARRKAGENIPIEWLWMTLARIAKEAPNKIPVFRAYLKDHPSILRRTLIFVETVEFGKLLQPVLMEHTRDFHTYYGTDDQVHLRRFARGELKVLLTAHRISEGIDIQAVDTVIIFSAARARLETIQRLGRCLRTDPANPGKRALVIDFVRADIEQVEGEIEVHSDKERERWLADLASVRRELDPLIPESC
jgi:superfamily II DNA or RNA helicase